MDGRRLRSMEQQVTNLDATSMTCANHDDVLTNSIHCSYHGAVVTIYCHPI